MHQRGEGELKVWKHPSPKGLVSTLPRVRIMQSYNAVEGKYTSVFTGIHKYIQLYMNVHKFVKVYKLYVPRYTKIYLGI